MPKQFTPVSVKEWMKRIPIDIDRLQWGEIYLNLQRPSRKTQGSSGYDFYAPFGFILAPGEEILIPTGFKSEMNIDEELLIFPRSGLGFKFYSRLANTVGKIDSDYFNNPDNEGHIFIKLRNEGDKTMEIDKFGAFAQGSFYNFLVCEGDDEDVKTFRKGGLGSTSE